MANNFYDTVKKQNTSAGTSGTGRSALSQALSIMNARSTASQPQQTQPAQINNVTNQQPQSSVISYNSGIRGTADYAKRNNTAFQQQYQLAKSAGVSKEQFYQDYSNGIRWLDQANNAGTGIRQYDSGVAGTREYAKAHMDEFQSQYQLAKQAGLTKDDFYREYSRGQRWTTELEEKPTNLDAANGTAKTLAEDEDYSRDLRAKIHTGLFDNDAIETRRLERLRKKYGTAVFDDNFAGQFKANFGMARIQEEYFQAVADYLDNPTEGNRQYRDDLKALLADFQMRNAEALDDQNVQAGWLSKNMASYFPQLWNQTKATIIPGAIGLAGTLLVGGADKGAFVKAGVTVGSGIYSYNSMRGAAFENLVDVGLDENTARSAANDEAVVSSIIEMADTAVDLFTMIPGLGSAAKEAAKDAAVKSMSKTLLKKVADYGFNIGEEYGEEFVQELLSMANQRRCLNGNADSGIKGLLAEALELAGEMLGGGAKDELAQAHEAGKGGAIIGAFMGGIHMGTGYVTTAISNNQIRNQLSNVNETNLGGYDDQNLQKLLNAAVNPATKNEQAAEYIRSEMDRRATFDNETANVDVGGILKTVDPKASEKAQQKVAEDNRKTLDNLTREDITPEKVDEQQLSKLFRECQILGSRKGYLVIANELNARLTENIKSAFQAQQEQETVQTQSAETDVAEPTVQTEAPVSPVAAEAVAAPAAVEAEPVTETVSEQKTAPVEAEAEERVSVEQQTEHLKTLSREDLLAALKAAEATRDFRTAQLIRIELQRRATAPALDNNQNQQQRREAPFGNERPRPGESTQDVLLRAMRKELKKEYIPQDEHPGFRDDAYNREESEYDGGLLDFDYTTLDPDYTASEYSDPEQRAINGENPSATQFTGETKERRIDGVHVESRINSKTGGTIDVAVLGDATSGDKAVTFSEDGKKFVPANRVNKNTPRLFAFLRRLGIPRFLVSTGNIKYGEMRNGNLTIADPSFSSGLYFPGTGNIACNMNDAGSPIHEIDHHIVYSAEQANSARAAELIDQIITEVLFDNESENAIRDKAKQLLKYDYRYENSITRETQKLLNANPDISSDDFYAAYQQIEAEVINDELLSAILEGRYLSNESGEKVLPLSGYSAKVLQNEKYQELFNLAFSNSTASNDDISMLFSLFEASTNLTTETGQSQNVGEFANLFQQIVLGRKNGKSIESTNDSTRQDARSRSADGQSRESGSGLQESGRRNKESTSGEDERSVQGRGRANVSLGERGTDASGIGEHLRGDSGQEGIISSFENSPEAEQTVEERRITHGSAEGEVGSLDDVDAAYRATFGTEERIPEGERWQNEAPRDVTAEERAAAAAADYEQREQRAYDARQESRKRARIEHGRNAAGIFAASTNIRNQKMSFDTDAENINTKTEEGRRQKRLIDAFDKIRTAAGQVADGTLSPGDFAEFYLNLQDDTNAAQFTMKHVAEAMQDLRQKYLAVLDNGNQHNADSYTAAAEKAMTMAEHSFRQINDAFTMQEQVAALIRQNGKGGAKSKNALVNLGRSLKNFYTRMQISPENMFRGMIGGWDQASRNLGYQISEDITKANIANQHVIAGSQMAYVPIRKMDGIEAFTSGKDKATVTTEHGFSATLSQSELAHLYKAIKTLEATQKRFGDRLETLDGFAFGDSDNPTFYDIQKDIENANKAIRDENKIAENEAKKTGKKPELKKEIDAAQYLREVREAIAAQLPEVAKKYIEISDDVLFDLGKQNSDVEMKVNGVRPMTYGKGDYISLHYANPNDTLSPIEKENIQFGFMNERTRAGGGYVRIVPLTVAMDQYINQSANHIAYSELGRTFELLNRDTSAGGKNIVSLMEEGYGKQFSEWMQNFIEDVQDQNPQERTDGISSILRAGRQAVQTGALVGSVSVPIKQVSSYWAASGKLRLSSLAKAYRPKIIPSKKGQFNQNKQNSLLLYNRKVGGIAPELSEAMKSNGAWAKLKQHSKLLQLVEKAIPMEDYLTVSNVYDACIIEMQEDNPNMDVNSQEFADLVESKFEEVVMETQPIFTKNARPEYARTDNELIKMLSMFRTQQTQNFNRMMRAIGEYRAAKGTANEFLKYSEMSETFKGQAASAMSLSILSIVADIVLHKLRKYRDDDEDDSLAPEKIVERFGLNAIEAASGTLWFGDSALKWAIDKLNESKGKDSNEFYGVNMGIISTVSNVVDSIGWFLDSPTLSNARYVAGYISQTFGIPLNNAVQMLNSATMYASDLLGKNEDHYDDILKMLDKEVIATRSDSDKDRARVLINAYLKGNESKAGRVSAMMDPEKNDAAVRADVQRRYMADKISSEEAQNILLRYTSMDRESVEKRNAFWDFLKEHPQYSDSDKYPGISESFVENYNSLAAPADIPVNKFYEYIRHGNDVKGIDVDGDGDTNGKEDITRKHQLSEYIGSLDISDEQKAALWQSYGYKIDERWDFILEHPDMEGVSKSFVEHYDEFAKPAGIPANNFYEYMQRFNSTKSIDADGDGKTNGKGDITKQSQIIEYINGLNLTKEQKDALWLAFGYKTTSKAYKSRPWK